MRGWDYVVVGAGAAGCVVAGRLSQTMPDDLGGSGSINGMLSCCAATRSNTTSGRSSMRRNCQGTVSPSLTPPASNQGDANVLPL